MDTPFPLGRLKQHDPQSRAFPFKAGVWDNVQHISNVGIFDQGNLGSCTGNAMAGVLTYNPYYGTLPNLKMDEALAVKLYSRATQLDVWQGEYPPEDTGSSGLAVAKAAKEFGFISGYQHAFSLNAMLTALMDGPVITGINWYENMFYPNNNGVVSVGGNYAGGHEVCADAIDKTNGLVWFRNSWGPDWGLKGRFAISISDYGNLLSDGGDATVLVPVTAPAPKPDYDAALVQAMEPWSKGIISKVTKAGKANAAYKLWKSQKGL